MTTFIEFVIIWWALLLLLCWIMWRTGVDH